MIEIAITTGADTYVKTVSAATLQIAIRKGILRFLPKTTPAGVIANIACVGIENIKIFSKIATGELSMTKGLDQMGRTTVSMIGGLCGGAAIGGLLLIAAGPFAVAGGLVGGMVGYLGGSKLGDAIYTAGKKLLIQQKI